MHMRQTAGIFGLLLVGLSLVLLSADLIASLEAGGHLVAHTIADVWAWGDAGGPARLTGWSEAHLPAPLSTTLAATLNLYAWLASGLIGVFLGFLSAPHHHKA